MNVKKINIFILPSHYRIMLFVLSMSLIGRVFICGTNHQIRRRCISKGHCFTHFSSVAEVANTNFENGVKLSNVNRKNKRSKYVDNEKHEYATEKRRAFINTINKGPTLKDFIVSSSGFPDNLQDVQNDDVPYLNSNVAHVCVCVCASNH